MKYWICASSPRFAAQSTVLKDSVEKHMPAYKFVELSSTDSFREIVERRLSAAIHYLEAGAKEIIVSGADVWVRKPFDLRQDADCLFCPHTFEMPEKERWTLMRGGLINSDFQVWRPGALNFLKKMADSLQELKAFSIFEEEQHWLPLALSMAGGKLIEDRSIGTAYYNLHERYMPSSSLIHFSGWDPLSTQLTKYPMPRILESGEQKILAEYAALVRKATR